MEDGVMEWIGVERGGNDDVAVAVPLFPSHSSRFPVLHTSLIMTGSPEAADSFAAMLTASDSTPLE
jgi:hypothetical protein